MMVFGPMVQGVSYCRSANRLLIFLTDRSTRFLAEQQYGGSFIRFQIKLNSQHALLTTLPLEGAAIVPGSAFEMPVAHSASFRPMRPHHAHIKQSVTLESTRESCGGAVFGRAVKGYCLLANCKVFLSLRSRALRYTMARLLEGKIAAITGGVTGRIPTSYNFSMLELTKMPC